MNAAILMMASAVTAGQPAPAPAAAAPAAPAVVAGTGGCSGGDCGASCDVGCSKKASLLDKIKSRLGGRKHHCGCDAAPACSTCAPAPAPAPAPTPCATCAPAPCDSCAAPRQSILDRLKAKFAGKKHHCHDCAPACDGCAAAPAPAPAPAAPAAPVPNPMPKTGAAPKAEVVVPGAVTPVSGPRLTGTTSPY